MISWKRQATTWRGAEGPFVVNVSPKGDGRWNWEIFADEGPNPTATGIGNSLGAAKNATEQFVKRSGRV
jgi:hypothetical protein